MRPDARRANRLLDAQDRAFLAALLLVAGPLLQAGGWAASFTLIGAIFVFGGSAMSLAGFLVRPSLGTLAAAVAGVLLGGWGWMAAFWILDA